MIGYQFFEIGGFAWRKHHGALVPMSMPHVSISNRGKGIRWLLVQHRAFLARWEEDFDQAGSGDWWHVIKSDQEDLSALSKKTRNQVRRGAKEGFQAGLACRKEIRSEGYSVYRASFERYKTFEDMYSKEAFEQAIALLPGQTEFWSVREEGSGRMVAFSENLVRDNACFYVTMWFRPEALKRYAGYLLIHEMNKHYLNERRLRYVSDGARSISHQTNIHEFLERKFDFRRGYARLRVVYAPGVGLAVWLLFPFRKWFNGPSAPLLQKISVLLEQERIRRACKTAEDGGG